MSHGGGAGGGPGGGQKNTKKVSRIIWMDPFVDENVLLTDGDASKGHDVIPDLSLVRIFIFNGLIM